MRMLPQQIDPAGFSVIEKTNLELEKVATGKGGLAWEKFQSDIALQNDFIEIFSRCFSITKTLASLDIKRPKYNKWRTTSILFVYAFNNVISNWYDDIMASAATRAKGHLVADEETSSGYKESADGTPIYHDADTPLTKMFLKAMHPEEFSENTSVKLEGEVSTVTRIVKVEGVRPKAAMTEVERKHE